MSKTRDKYDIYGGCWPSDNVWSLVSSSCDIQMTSSPKRASDDFVKWPYCGRYNHFENGVCLGCGAPLERSNDDT